MGAAILWFWAPAFAGVTYSVKIPGFGDEAAEEPTVIDEPPRDEVDDAAFLLYVALDAEEPRPQ